ncbi:DUF6531 domain-containing protein [Streptomyces benahoarensis]|uniref:DUF6531 domain-containing protein n=1 Tax=Streptomyces benahoarensis TaxID=2595054 RepID=UPI00163D4A72|nr:DUF6531 domain-containing protein [Streptomyces benahoarensis]
MTNPIVKALEHGAAKLGQTLGKDAGKAVEDLYHGTGKRLKKAATHHAENDAKHAKELDKILKGDKENMPHAPHSTSGGGRPSDGGRPGGAHEQARAGNAHDSTREEKGRCTDGTDPVDLATGRVFLSDTDIALPGALSLVFTRTYESSTRIGRHIGPSWSSTIDQRPEIGTAEIIFVTESGMLLRYPRPEIGERVLPRYGPRWPLMRTLRGTTGPSTTPRPAGLAISATPYTPPAWPCPMRSPTATATGSPSTTPTRPASRTPSVTAQAASSSSPATRAVA